MDSVFRTMVEGFSPGKQKLDPSVDKNDSYYVTKASKSASSMNSVQRISFFPNLDDDEEENKVKIDSLEREFKSSSIKDEGEPPKIHINSEEEDREHRKIIQRNAERKSRSDPCVPLDNRYYENLTTFRKEKANGSIYTQIVQKENSTKQVCILFF
jgi:hypothetical protein